MIQDVRDKRGGLKGVPMKDIVSDAEGFVRQKGLGKRKEATKVIECKPFYLDLHLYLDILIFTNVTLNR